MKFIKSEPLLFTLREKHGLKVSGNKVFANTFGTSRDNLMRNQKKLHDTELRNLYFSKDNVCFVPTHTIVKKILVILISLSASVKSVD